jgi:hypothetical protein
MLLGGQATHILDLCVLQTSHAHLLDLSMLIQHQILVQLASPEATMMVDQPLQDINYGLIAAITSQATSLKLQGTTVETLHLHWT